jgi:hypothetical protein
MKPLDIHICASPNNMEYYPTPTLCIVRDFAAAGLIGAKSLLGLSWPDLDMLPIGYLTDSGSSDLISSSSMH